MPAVFSNVLSRYYVLTVQGVNLTRSIPVESIRVSETGTDSNSTMEFDVSYPIQGSFDFGSSGRTLDWTDAGSQDVRFADSVNQRVLFKGNVVNTRLSHQGASGAFVHVTCIGYNAWLDRLIIPKYVSKRANGVAIVRDREMVQSVGVALGATPAGNFAWDSLDAYIESTNTNMPVVKVEGGSARDVLQAIADNAATLADPTPRRFYVDMDLHLRYASGSFGLSAPYLIGQVDYSHQVNNTAGLVSYWHFNEASGSVVYDTENAAHATLVGGTRLQPALVANEGGQLSTSFGGSAYASANGAVVGLPDSPWSFECWFKRSSSGAFQTFYSGGNNTVQIRFNSSNQIQVLKENVGSNFVSDDAVAQGTVHHLAVTRTAAPLTTVYLDGVAMTGTTTARTFSAPASNVNIGRKLSTTDEDFIGSLSHVAVYNVALDAATVLAHARFGLTIVPDEFDFESDFNGSGQSVYVKGATAAGTGWVRLANNSTYRQSFIIDAPDSNTANKRDAIGIAFLQGEGARVIGGHATVMGYDGWRAMQNLTVYNPSLGVSAVYEIRQVDTTFGGGNGVNTYDIYFGSLPWSGTFDIQRKRRRGNHLSSPTVAS